MAAKLQRRVIIPLSESDSSLLHNLACRVHVLVPGMSVVILVVLNTSLRPDLRGDTVTRTNRIPPQDKGAQRGVNLRQRLFLPGFLVRPLFISAVLY